MTPKLIACVVLAGLLLPGCTKFDDEYVGDETVEYAAKRKKSCQVQKLKVWWYSTYREINFIYNAAGNPTDMLVNDLGVPGFSDNDYEYHWRYDHKGRLTDYYDNLRGNLGVFVWHRYFYPNKKIIIDTAFTYSGLITDPIPPNAGTAYGYYAYFNHLDNKDRIIRTTLNDSGTPPYVTEFAYNAQGNLTLTDWTHGTPVPYDNKVNVYRTHPVWMQIYQDYSLNNALPSNLQITHYNESGLPVKYKRTAIGMPGFLFGHIFDSLEVVYDCGKDKWTGSEQNGPVEP